LKFYINLDDSVRKINYISDLRKETNLHKEFHKIFDLFKFVHIIRSDESLNFIANVTNVFNMYSIVHV